MFRTINKARIDWYWVNVTWNLRFSKIFCDHHDNFTKSIEVDWNRLLDAVRKHRQQCIVISSYSYSSSTVHVDLYHRLRCIWIKFIDYGAFGLNSSTTVHLDLFHRLRCIVMMFLNYLEWWCCLSYKLNEIFKPKLDRLIY